MTPPLTLEMIGKAPKALLHDHLDGGLRPETIIELAGQIGYNGLPSTDATGLTAWFRTAA
ncbi:MAG: adenosine deaminase, partial [Mycobacterium sp.]